ncbi:MAG: purine-nucleoside phosphorylase [Defluviitaleaceae bacterium]|nr:purine-nucleoside phosphorylase [Defluviitaleaceae bacterium]MCL2261876.1 purine-nucleoside phosphorylase [Defluviitaleaceae bacterium]
MSLPTPHIDANAGAFAKTVLMPGDPLRAKFIAENFLETPKKVNEIRGMLGYTGTYNGTPVSVMGSGMGCPSMGIYSYELFNFYKVDNIIRVGSAGAISMGLELGDVVMGVGACTEGGYTNTFARCPGGFAPTASFDLMLKAWDAAKMNDVKLHAGNLLTTDVFYNDDNVGLNAWMRMGILAVEMEAAALYSNAARAGKNALCICTISDKVFDRDKKMSAKERETSFTNMINMALSML